MDKTKLSELYEMFLSSINDYTFIKKDASGEFLMSDEDIKYDLQLYLNSAIAKFYKCKNDLTIDYENDCFNSKLTPYEIQILINLMRVEYMYPQIFTSEIIKQSLSDGDFKIYSQANHLRELQLLHRTTKKGADKMINDYTYFSLEDDLK